MDNNQTLSEWTYMARATVAVPAAEILVYTESDQTIHCLGVAISRPHDFSMKIPTMIPDIGPLDLEQCPKLWSLHVRGVPFHGTTTDLFEGVSSASRQAFRMVPYVYAWPCTLNECQAALVFYSRELFSSVQLRDIRMIGKHIERAYMSSYRFQGESFVALDHVRREIADRLHGPIQTKLLIAWHRAMSLSEQTASFSPEQVADSLKEIAAIIDEVREKDIRELSHAVHPGLIHVALRPALEQLVDRFGSALEICLQFDPVLEAIDSMVDNRIPEEIRLASYRIIEEALSNAVHHGHARSVSIQVGVANAHLTLSINDDGVGVDDIRSQEGFGMATMRARVRQCSGTLVVQSSPLDGTTVTVSLPLGRYPQPRRGRQRIRVSSIRSLR